MFWSERWPADLYFAFCALDADGWSGSVMPIWIGSNAEIRQRDTMRCMIAAQCGGKGEQDGGLFVDAGSVFFDGGEDGGGFAGRGGDGMVDGLEAPC